MGFVSKYSDVILAAFVVLVVGMMIIPLPTGLLDVLLTFNIAIGITILLVVLYITSAIRLASFPSLLLIATLFRLALNVSTTRLILLKGDAGRVVEAFGNFVVQGNMVVGAIVFLILTLVNFIVISKGSERVAEVSARFTLDAMPGKQMAIDADLRAGAFDLQEARTRRRELSRESQLFGAMDGAMKFVKGDAIAGILITAVNIVGGLIIGIWTKQMTLSEAIELYGILTIGDGLLSQLPALIVSVASGLMVTRVDPELTGDHLGKDLSTQILAYPKALIIVSVLLLILGFVPALPLLPFWFLSGSIGMIGLFLLGKNEHDKSGPVSLITRVQSSRANQIILATPSPITLLAGRNVLELLSSDNPDSQFFKFLEPKLRQEIYWETGVQIPGIRIQGAPGHLQKDSFEIYIMDTLVYRGLIPSDKAFVKNVNDDSNLMSAMGEILCDEFKECGLLIPENQSERLTKAGFEVVTGSDLIILQMKKIISYHAAEFLGLQEVKWLCDELEKLYPDTVNETVPRVISYQRLCDILRRLVQENVSIRDLKRILEALSEYADSESDNITLTDKIRVRLGRQIYHQYAKRGHLEVFLLDPSIESMFQSSIHVTGQERLLALAPQLMEQVISTFNTHFSNNGNRPSIIMTVEQNIRYVLWRFLAQQIQGIKVLAAQEMPIGSQFVALGHIALLE
ncbi:FHIPEP family type III secretion protein [bacterium]|nr:FHIPEP family type III secretion protein [candidate division CSSED10-310 bacterium]